MPKMSKKRALIVVSAILGVVLIISAFFTLFRAESITVAKSLKANGLCYGPFRDGQSPNAEIFPSADQIREDLVNFEGYDESHTYL